MGSPQRPNGVCQGRGPNAVYQPKGVWQAPVVAGAPVVIGNFGGVNCVVPTLIPNMALQSKLKMNVSVCGEDKSVPTVALAHKPAAASSKKADTLDFLSQLWSSATQSSSSLAGKKSGQEALSLEDRVWMHLL